MTTRPLVSGVLPTRDRPFLAAQAVRDFATSKRPAVRFPPPSPLPPVRPIATTEGAAEAEAAEARAAEARAAEAAEASLAERVSAPEQELATLRARPPRRRQPRRTDPSG